MFLSIMKNGNKLPLEVSLLFPSHMFPSRQVRGFVSLVLGDGMTRGLCVRIPTLECADAANMWLDIAAGFQTVEAAFNFTTRFGRLQSIKSVVAGSDVFGDMRILSLSGNYCADKKAAAINWIDG